mmetsp:Transcript_92557/g.238957  ORF Transcript_92557/g.238957 Transcript_92557/m.238957 type:complete len:290 (-) Transcript_92557:4629-5498(-)
MLVLDQGIDNLGAELEHLVVHITCAAGEATPVRKDHEGQVLAAVEVFDGSRRLEGTVREPDLASLGLDHLLAVRIRRVGRNPPVRIASLHCNDAHGDATELGAADDDTAAPALQVFLESALIEEASELALRRGCAGQHLARVVRALRRREGHVPLHGVGGWQHRRHGEGVLGREGEPVQDSVDALLVALHELVGDAVGHHHLRPSELVLGGVHFLSEQLVQRAEAGEDHGAVNHLDDTLAQAVEVGPDAHRAARHVREGEDLIVSARSLTGDEAAALQILHTDATGRGL